MAFGHTGLHGKCSYFWICYVIGDRYVFVEALYPGLPDQITELRQWIRRIAYLSIHSSTAGAQ
jgi:hypothetical protein